MNFDCTQKEKVQIIYAFFSVFCIAQRTPVFRVHTPMCNCVQQVMFVKSIPTNSCSILAADSCVYQYCWKLQCLMRWVYDKYTGTTLTIPKASELVPCSLLTHWNLMRFFTTVSLYDSNSVDEVKFTTL